MLGLGSLLYGAAVERPHASLSPRSDAERTEQLLSDQTNPPSSPPSAPGASKMNEQWCPSACPLKPERLVASSSNDKAGGIITAWNASGINTSTPKCNLCDSPFLFVVSIGGRTASTTLLTLLNAIPNVRLAGENGGQMNYVASLYELASKRLSKQGRELYCDDPDDVNSQCGAYQRGAISPYNVLCDLNAYVRDIAVPVLPLLPSPQINVRGFKDIIWSARSLAMLRTAFPCSRVVYSVRDQALSEAVTVYKEEFHLSPAKALAYAAAQAELLAFVNKTHMENLASGNGWKSHWMPLKDLSTDSVNAMVKWLGVRGCKFEKIVQSNSGISGYSQAGATPSDAKKNLVGECQWDF